MIQAPCNLVQCTVLASNIELDITVCTIKKSQQHFSAQLCVQSKNLNCIFLEVALLNVVLLLFAKISSSLPVTNLLKEIVSCNQLGIFIFHPKFCKDWSLVNWADPFRSCMYAIESKGRMKTVERGKKEEKNGPN